MTPITSVLDQDWPSRQVAKLESLGLVEWHAAAADRRISQATVTAKGKAMTNAVDRARERIVGAIFATWDDHDVEELVRLVRKLADAVTSGTADKEARPGG